MQRSSLFQLAQSPKSCLSLLGPIFATKLSTQKRVKSTAHTSEQVYLKDDVLTRPQETPGTFPKVPRQHRPLKDLPRAAFHLNLKVKAALNYVIKRILCKHFVVIFRGQHFPWPSYEYRDTRLKLTNGEIKDLKKAAIMTKAWRAAFICCHPDQSCP